MKKILSLLCVIFLTTNTFSQCLTTPTPIGPGTASAPGPFIPNLTPVISWTAVGGVNNYELNVSIFPYGSSNLVFSQCIGTVTSYMIPPGILTSGNLYRWNLRAYKNPTFCSVSGTTPCSSTLSGFTPVLHFRTNCSYSLSSSGNNVSASGGSFNVSVITQSGCTWNSSNNGNSWISISSSGTGSGTATYVVSQNFSTSSRSGNITIAGQNFSVFQFGVSCTYSLGSSGNNVSASGGNFNVSVNTQSGCSWSSNNNGNSWISISSSGTGSGTASYFVSQNFSTSSRSGNIIIAGQTFTVFQFGISCTYSLGSSSNNVPSNSGTYFVSVNTQSGCSWNSSNNGNSWITISSSGTGSGTASYFVSQNFSSSARSGTITIAGQNFTITQAGACTSPSVSNPPNRNVQNGATNITFPVTATGPSFSCQWQRSTNGGGTWFNLSNSPPYFNVTTSTLTVSPANTNMNGYRFRCVVSVSPVCGTAISNLGGILTVGNNTQPPPLPESFNDPNGGSVSDPIELANGSYRYNHVDLTIPTKGSPIVWARHYNSLSNTNYSLGYKWCHSYDFRVINYSDTLWALHHGDGHESYFVPDESGVSVPLYGGTFETLIKNGNGTYTLTFKNQEIFLLNTNGILISITDRNGNVTMLNISGGNLTSVVGPGGRSISLNYDGSNRLTDVIAPDGRVIHYTYDGQNDLRTVTDANGGITQFIYDNFHRITQIIDARNNTLLTNTYDGFGHVISQSDAYNNPTNIVYTTPPPGDATVTFPGGATHFFHHDSFYRLTNETDELGHNITYTYDTDNNRISKTDENGNTNNYSYDSKGNVTIINRPMSNSTSITYNSKNDPLTIINALSNPTTFAYNTPGNLTTVTNALSNSRNASYDGAGQITAITDALSHTTSFAHNSFGDITTATNPVGASSFTYDAAGRIVTATDANGHPSTFTYDNNDFIKTVTDALGQVIRYFYDANNNLVELKDKKGLSTHLTYDNKDRLVTIQDPMNGTTNFSYDVRDNLVSVTDPIGHAVSYVYDAKNRLTSSLNALGTTTYTRDGVGNLLTETDATSHTTTYTYDALYRITAIADALSNTSHFAYDALGQLLTVTDALTHPTTYSYNSMGQLTTVQDANGINSGFSYDANGNRLTVTDPNGHITHFTYDAMNRLVSSTDALGNADVNTYDAKGNIITALQANGTSATYSYDVIDRLTQIAYSTGENNTYTYDPNDNLLNMGNAGGTSAFLYDDNNRVTAMTDPFSNQVGYSYNPAGLRTSITYPGSRTVNYQYNGVNAMTQVTDWLNHSTSYSYDQAGRLTGMNYPNGTHCNYTYDNAGRMTEIANRFSNNNIINQSIFTLNAIGNRTGEQRTEPLATQLTAQSLTYSYAADNRLQTTTAVAYNNDPSGNRVSETGANATTFNWTANNLLASYTRVAQLPTTFQYDPLGNRIKRTQGANQRKYLLDLTQELSQVLEEYDGAGISKGTYIYGLGLIARVDSASNFQYYHFDAQGNTVALTNDVGQITDTYTYKPFGELLNHTGNSQQPFLFSGRHGILGEGSNLYFVRARYYDASTGRFISKDQLNGFASNPQTFNRFVYGLNNPVLFSDVNGLFCQENKIVAIGAKVWDGYTNKVNSILNGYVSGINWIGVQISNEYDKSIGANIYGGVKDFWSNYDDMLNANWKNSDKYFHAKANFQATQRGPVGEFVATRLSNLREIVQQRFYGESRVDAEADQEANRFGREQANQFSEYDYQKALEKYRPKGLPWQY